MFEIYVYVASVEEGDSILARIEEARICKSRE